MALDATKILRLRQKIFDLAESVNVFSLYITDSDCTQGLATVSADTLTISVTGGSLSALTISLTGTSYDTLGELVNHINTNFGYKAVLRSGINRNHDSDDIEEFYSADILNKPWDFRTAHFFDDSFLEDELEDAIYIHIGTSYTWDTLPVKEENLVILKAAISCLYTKAAYASKYYPVDTEGSSIDKGRMVDQLLSVAEAYEEQYQSGIDSYSEGGAKVHPGWLYRKSTIKGYHVPYARENWPTAVTLNSGYTPTTTSLTISWDLCKDEAFYSYKVYYSTSSGVTTASTMANEITDRAQLSYIITGLITGTDYYVKIFTKSLSSTSTNSIIASSNEIAVTTS